MIINKSIIRPAAILIALLLLTPATLSNAMNTVETINPEPPIIYIDGQRLQPKVDPIIINGNTLVPMRDIFEEQGAELEWNAPSRKVTATKDDISFTYIIGQTKAYKNNQPLSLSVPGQIVDGYTLVPLRLVSETLGNVVKWHPKSRTISISSAKQFETSVDYGINLRDNPSSGSNSLVYRLIPKGERVHVIREIDANWLEVQTKDMVIGFISAKPMYTDYSSPSLVNRQADELIAYGETFAGTPYEFGASPNQTDTFDCSSFVKHVFKHVLGMDLPRVSYNQAGEGQEISKEDLRKGDLVFFSARGLDIGHVGIYAGNNQILHTFSKEKGVHYSSFDGQLKERFDTARRLF
ncbi:MAG: stalk domain-containing protein [Paenibacillaceae bacterium]